MFDHELKVAGYGFSFFGHSIERDVQISECLISNFLLLLLIFKFAMIFMDIIINIYQLLSFR